MDDGLLHLFHGAVVGERPDRRPVIDVLLLGEAATVEELPPRRLVLAPVELQQVRQQLPRPLLAVELRPVGRQARRQGLEQGRDLDRRFLLPVAFLVPEGRPRHRLSGRGFQLAPALLQPLGEAQRREAVVAVVVRDLGTKLVRRRGGVTRLEPHLETDERPRRREQVHPAHEAVERLEPLDRVALDRGPHPLSDHAVEVDEDPAAQQPVDLVLAGRVAAHQALGGGGLVGAVVVDVEPGMLLPPRHDAVDEALERRFLARRVEGPVGVVRAVPGRGAEQVLQAAVRRERVSFEVEEDIARRRPGQRRESLARLDRRDELVDAVAFAPRLVLHPRLLADPRQRAGADAVQPGDGGQLQRAERRHGRHSPLGEPSPLAAGDAGYQRQVIVGAAPLRAALLPLAEAAVLDRLGIGLGRRLGVRLEPPADGAVVGRVLHHPKARVVPLVAAAEGQVHPFRRGFLRQGQQVRVQEELQQRRALRAAGQLGV